MSEEGEAKEGLALKADELNPLPPPSELTVSVCYIVTYISDCHKYRIRGLFHATKFSRIS